VLLSRSHTFSWSFFIQRNSWTCCFGQSPPWLGRSQSKESITKRNNLNTNSLCTVWEIYPTFEKARGCGTHWFQPLQLSAKPLKKLTKYQNTCNIEEVFSQNNANYAYITRSCRALWKPRRCYDFRKVKTEVKPKWPLRHLHNLVWQKSQTIQEERELRRDFPRNRHGDFLEVFWF